jgi:hypothetical protein
VVTWTNHSAHNNERFRCKQTLLPMHFGKLKPLKVI